MIKLIFFAALLSVSLAQFDWGVWTALDEYVSREDNAYEYQILAEHRYNACTVYVVNMTSQRWRDESYVDRPVWYHWMGVAVPDEANLTFPDAGFLIINGGSNEIDEEPPGRDDGLNVGICVGAIDTGTVGGYISEVPNQPLYFQNDPEYKRRSEDDIIAWTWRTFLDDGRDDPEVILRMPMTKAAKRAFDTIYNVAKEKHDYTDVSRFMVTGGSKRGWTAWSVAAVDRRVIALAPLVFSMLKFNETLMSHFRSLGGAWSFAFAPYWEVDLTKELKQPYVDDLFQHEDMYWYRERFTMPLLQMVSTGDEFFLLQDSHQWWDEMPDPKWTYMLENAEHSMFPHYVSLYSTLTAWYQSILEGTSIPTVTWDRGAEPDGTGFINFYTDTAPENITVYRAVTLKNDTRRDFRLATGNETIGITFHPVIWDEEDSTLTEVVPGREWRATTNPEEDEWVGFLVQGMWRGPDGQRMFFTSETEILPDTFPVEECTDADSCYGILV